MYCEGPQRVDRQRIAHKIAHKRLALQLMCQCDDGCVESWQYTNSIYSCTFVKCSFKYTDGAQLIALAQIQMIAVRYSVVSIDFIPFLICCEVFSRMLHDVTVHKYYLRPHSRSTVVQSYRSRAVKAA